MTGALAIFAKTPGLSPVKTRLAAQIGTQNAEQFYQYSVQCLEALALQVTDIAQGNIVPYWAIGEADGIQNNMWQKIDRMWTGAGGLGDRLHHVYSTLLKKHDHVILIGTDSPQLSTDKIITAHNHLKTKSGHVIGPADDGGYYLYGGHTALPHELWVSVPYSVSETCAVFTENLTAYGQIFTLEKTFDVDTEDDLDRLRHSLHDMTSPPQQTLIKWLNKTTFRANEP